MISQEIHSYSYFCCPSYFQTIPKDVVSFILSDYLEKEDYKNLIASRISFPFSGEIEKTLELNLKILKGCYFKSNYRFDCDYVSHGASKSRFKTIPFDLEQHRMTPLYEKKFQCGNKEVSAGWFGRLKIVERGHQGERITYFEPDGGNIQDICALYNGIVFIATDYNTQIYDVESGYSLTLSHCFEAIQARVRYHPSYNSKVITSLQVIGVVFNSSKQPYKVTILDFDDSRARIWPPSAYRISPCMRARYLTKQTVIGIFIGFALLVVSTQCLLPLGYLSYKFTEKLIIPDNAAIVAFKQLHLEKKLEVYLQVLISEGQMKLAGTILISYIACGIILNLSMLHRTHYF